MPLQLEEKPNISLNISGQKFIYYQDYVSYLNGPDREYKSEKIIFAGYGIDDPNYSDYKNINVKGKVVVALGGEPKDENDDYFINGKNKSKWSILRQEIDNKKRVARSKGALALIIIDNYLHGGNAYYGCPWWFDTYPQKKRFDWVHILGKSKKPWYIFRPHSQACPNGEFLRFEHHNIQDQASGFHLQSRGY